MLAISTGSVLEVFTRNFQTCKCKVDTTDLDCIKAVIFKFREFFTMYQKCDSRGLSEIAIGDETWIRSELFLIEPRIDLTCRGMNTFSRKTSLTFLF